MIRKNALGPLFTLAGALLMAAPMAVSAQDYFREYGTSRSSGGIGPIWPNDYTYRDITPSELQTDDATTAEIGHRVDEHNFALGPIRFSLAASLGVEFNDNVAYSEFDRKSDIVLRPGLNIEADLPINTDNTIRFGVSLSYAKYLSNSQYDSDGILVSPTSALEFRFTLGQVHFTARDRFSYQEDPYDIPQLSGAAQYERYENQAGIVADWDVNTHLNLSGGFDHYNLWTTEDDFSDQDRAVETVFLKPAWKISDNFSVGVNGTYSYISFDSKDRSDGYSLLIGPFIDWHLNDNTEVYLEGGFQSLEFDGSYQPSNVLDHLQLTDEQRRLIEREASTDNGTESFYVRFQIDQKLSDVLRHRLSFSRTEEIGFFSDYYDLYHVEYGAEFTGINHVSVGPSVFYEYYDASGPLGEQAHRVGATLGIRYFLTNNLTLGLDYRYLWKDSNVQGGDYYQNLVFLSAFYKF